MLSARIWCPITGCCFITSSRLGKPHDGLALTPQDFFRRLEDLLGQPARTVFHALLAFAQGQHIARAGTEFDLVQRLDEEVVGPRLQRVVTHLDLIVGRDHEHGDILAPLKCTEGLDETDAAELGHHVVHHDQVRAFLLAMAQCQLRIGELQDLVLAPELYDEMLEQKQVGFHVIDDHDLHGGVACVFDAILVPY